MKKPVIIWLLKLCLRIMMGGMLLVFLSLATFITLGYFAALKPVSYLPEMPANHNGNSIKGSDKAELKGAGFTLIVKENGEISVEADRGEVILSKLTYYTSFDGLNDKWGLDSVSVNTVSDSVISVIGRGAKEVLVKMLITVRGSIPRFDVNVKTHYSNSTLVRREALVAEFNENVSEVYLKNGQLVFGSFDTEYWLQRQGVRFGSGNKSALVYHTPDVSSLQLNTTANLLLINLDYYLDHPHINIPFQADDGADWTDLSMAKYEAGDERTSNFSIYIGEIPKVTPRLMLVPDGYLAGYVFTEHADWGNIRTHRAAYFGSEDISDIKEAKGGFAGHKIPVTKSVFYSQPGGPSGSSIRDDPDFPQLLNFLEQLYSTGQYDICLHTPESGGSNREELEEAIKFMKDKFDSKTWIDHGMYGGKSNRESLVADGLNPNSTLYAADLWERYDTRYFWSSAPELIRNYSLKENFRELKFYEVSVNLWKRYLSPAELKRKRFLKSFKAMVSRYNDKGELNSLLSYKGNAFPTPLFWLHPTRTADFYSWVTDYVKPVSDLSERYVTTEKKLLDKLVSDRGIFINHGYYVRRIPGEDVLSESNGKLVINPYFDKILGIMAQMRDDGDLYITTIRDLLDYWILTEKISFDYLNDGTILLTNNNDKPVKGLSLVIRADNVRIDGAIPSSRRVDENTIFWFDIAAGKTIRIEIEKNKPFN